MCSFKCDDLLDDDDGLSTTTSAGVLAEYMPLNDRLCKCNRSLAEAKCAARDDVAECKRDQLPCPRGPFLKDLDGCDLCACRCKKTFFF